LGFVDVNESDAEFGFNKYLILFTTGLDSMDIFSAKTFETY
jgi:hypothetical protein